MKMNKITWFTVLSILIITVVIGLVAGITFAFMKPKVDASEGVTGVSITSCAKIKLTSESSINLTNSYPMSRNQALNKDPYVFQVTSTCEDVTGFNLYIATLSTNTLTDEKIRYILMENGTTNVLAEGLLNTAEDTTSEFTDYLLQEYATGMSTETSNIKKIYRLYAYTGAISDNMKYDLYLYVDGDVTDNVDAVEEFSAGVAIKAA